MANKFDGKIEFNSMEQLLRKDYQEKDILLEETHAFKEHPFLVRDDEAMDQLVRDASTYAAGSRFLVWWKGSCGHSYRAVIRDMYRGMPCPICERRKERNIPEKALIYYLKRMKIRYETNHQEITGLPLEIFLPDDRAAVECWEESQETDYAYARERCKNIACIQAGIKMIRILPRKARTYDNCLCILRKDKSIKSLEQAIAVSLRAIGIYNKTVDINLARDMEMVKIIPFERMLLKEYDSS